MTAWKSTENKAASDTACLEPAVRESLMLAGLNGTPGKAAEKAGAGICLEEERENAQPRCLPSENACDAGNSPPGVR